MLTWPGMKRISLAAVVLAVVAPLGACILPDNDEPDLIWNVEVTSSQVVVGQTTNATSDESLPSGESPMPLTAMWYALPEGLVQLSSDVGSTITIRGLAPGIVTLHASAGGAQGGVNKEVELRVVAP